MFFFFNDTATTEIYTLSLHDALPISKGQNVSPAYEGWRLKEDGTKVFMFGYMNRNWLEEPNVPVGPENLFSPGPRSEEHTSELQSRQYLVCRLLLEKKKTHRSAT